MTVNAVSAWNIQQYEYWCYPPTFTANPANPMIILCKRMYSRIIDRQTYAHFLHKYCYRDVSNASRNTKTLNYLNDCELKKKSIHFHKYPTETNTYIVFASSNL